MDAKDFVRDVRDTLISMKANYFADGSETYAASVIADMGLTEKQKAQMEVIIGDVITDVAYTILLGIDGAASLGESQQEFQLFLQDQGEESRCCLCCCVEEE